MKNISLQKKLSALNRVFGHQATDANFTADLLRLALIATLGRPVALRDLEITEADGLGFNSQGAAVSCGMVLGSFALQVAPDLSGTALFDGVALVQSTPTSEGVKVHALATPEARAALLRMQGALSLGCTFTVVKTMDVGETHLEQGTIEDGDTRYPYRLRQTADGHGLLTADLGGGFTQVALAQPSGKDEITYQ